MPLCVLRRIEPPLLAAKRRTEHSPVKLSPPLKRRATYWHRRRFAALPGGPSSGVRKAG